MKTITYKPAKLRADSISAITNLAGIGLGQGNTPEMIKDTCKHVGEADRIILVYDEDRLAAFAMTQERLWRSCH